ncbi:YicS family protein [Serratia rubidaea]|uniref:Uncharacterized protein YicS n=1 Tax=Serratia rubidaea TaxID=61652 RepID=A0A3S5B0V8_SERRU|nr:YicS family protein [Serratia rubidaea]MBD8453053.1 hypothetical protein [Serratia rubidaea]MBS0973239.1 hypothetical protein [Serratia rubidaea]MCR0998139.1 hypothetical protein [Serratia rubidaea]MDC6110805.1 hypothetical protein [Serratia rubidaea]MDC6119112.1 hypothetical protein [Serratia rubidaea]
MMIRWILSAALLLPAFGATAGAYDSLAFALNQQTLINDLRTHCQIAKEVPDEKIKSVFTNSKENHEALSATASALKNHQQEQYQQQLQRIRCPDFTRQ